MASSGFVMYKWKQSILKDSIQMPKIIDTLEQQFPNSGHDTIHTHGLKTCQYCFVTRYRKHKIILQSQSHNHNLVHCIMGMTSVWKILLRKKKCSRYEHNFIFVG